MDGASLESTLTSCEAASCDAACVDWTCLEEPPPGRSPIRLTVVVGDALVAPSPVAGLLVRRCRPFGVDRTCGVEAEQTTGGAGVAGFDVHLDAKARFDGYFEISDPSGRYLPQIVFPLPPPRADTAIYVSVLTPVTREQIAESLGIQGRPEGRGDILVHAVDCARRDVAGLHLALGGAADASATEFYLSRAVPISAARGATATDSFLALGGFLDLTPGSYGLQGMASRDGQPFTAFSTGVYVLPRTLTVIDYASRR